MKKILNYEKEILFKTKITEITSISLENDFTIDEGKLVGDFIISGEYKMSDISINSEKFNYRLPLIYEFEDTVDIDTFKYEIDNFEYNYSDDILNIIIDVVIRYEEKTFEPIIPIIKEDEINEDERDMVNNIDNEVINENNTSNELLNNNTNVDNDDNEYITYHVHIYKETDSMDAIIKEYNTTLDLIKEYNNLDNLGVGSKIIIPDTK